MKLSASATGIFCLTSGIALFSVQDLILKLLSTGYPLHQAMVFRSLTAIPFLLVITFWADGTLTTLFSRNWQQMLGRGVLNFFAYTAYYLALAALPMTTAIALYFTSPLIITILSVVMLHETVSRPRWFAVAVGFIGVLILVRPGGDLADWAAILPILCAAAYALMMIYARTMGQTETAAAMAFWSNLAFLGCALLLSALYGPGAYEGQSHPSLAFLMRGWQWPGLADLALMCLCGGIAAGGLTLLTQAYRVARSSTVAPFEYSFIFWGVLWSWWFWDELPDLYGWLGITIIIGAGLFILQRERFEARTAPLTP